MKFKNIFFTLMVTSLINCFAMDESSEEGFIPDEEAFITPIRLIRTETDQNHADYASRYSELKKSFREAVTNNDLSSAREFLSKIEDIWFEPGLRFSNPKLRKDIDEFLDSVEVDEFRIDYRLYKNDLKKELDKLLVKGDKQILPKELTEIIYEYNYPKELEINKLT